MYSMVLMVALTGSADVPDFGRRGGCCGGCWGGCYGGCWGGSSVAWGGYALPTYAYGAPVTGSAGTMVASPRTTTYQSGYYGPGTEASMAPATIVVHLPADARLTIDGDATRSTGETRTFQTPPLEAGKTFHYELEALAERNGEKVRASKRVEVRAGRPAEVSLDFPAIRERRE
jgi:uncharacterized protein (TIGR03000 family)